MEIVFIFLAVFSLIILANIIALRNRVIERQIFNGLLFLANLPVLFLGLIFLLIPLDFMAEAFAQMGATIENPRSIGLILTLTAVWGLLVCLSPLRKLLGRIMPIDPQSPVHTTALVMVGYLVGQGALSLSQDGLEGLAETAEPTSIGFFALSELLFALVALLGVGLFTRRGWRPLFQRLGLEKPKPLHWLWGLGWIIVLVVVQAIAGAVWALMYPEQAELLDNVNSLLLGEMDTVWEWFILALAAGIGEELLFRGALQPVMGIGFTAVVFALVHVQYGFTPIMLFVVFLAIVLGLVRRYYNTTIAIFVHIGYDFALGLLALLATYLEQFVT